MPAITSFADYCRVVAAIPLTTCREYAAAPHNPGLRVFIAHRDRLREDARWNWCALNGRPPRLFVEDILRLWPQQ